MKTIITIAMAIAPMLASAHDCGQLGQIARSAMMARQAGAPLAEMLEKMPLPVYKEILLTAFEEPRYATAQYQQRAAQDHQARWELACLRGKIEVTQ